MTKTIIHDKQILFLALVVAFFVGASITGVFFDYDAEAKKDNNNGNNGCEKTNPNSKACENNPNTTLTCESCNVQVMSFKEIVL